MSVRRILLLGATSAIAEAYARRLASSSVAFTLVGRRRDLLDAIAADLIARGAAGAVIVEADFLLMERMQELWSQCLYHGMPDEVLVAFGSLGDQAEAERDPAACLASLNINFVVPALWLHLVAEGMAHGPDKRIVAIGSVAGDRGRQSNYVYGAAKAGLDTFLEGLAHRLHPKGTKVVTIKPGFVDTPMTAHISKGGPLWAKPDQVAQDIVTAVQKGVRVRYTPWFWRPIMAIVRNVPNSLFVRTRL